MLALLWFHVAARREFNVTTTERKIIPMSLNDELFFVTEQPNTAFILHSVKGVIASVNTQIGDSVTNLGYIGHESRSFGVYLGNGTGSLTIQAKEPVTLVVSYSILPKECASVYVSTAVRERFAIGPRETANATFRKRTNICFWHTNSGNSSIRVSVDIPEDRTGEITSVISFNAERPSVFESSFHVERNYYGSFISLFKPLMNISRRVNVSVEVSGLDNDGYIAEDDYRTYLIMSQKPQFLIDEEHIHALPPPPRKNRTQRPEDTFVPPPNPKIMACLLLSLCLASTIVMVISFFCVYRKKQRIHEIQMHRLMEIKDGDEKQYIPQASRPAPKPVLFGSDQFADVCSDEMHEPLQNSGDVTCL